MNIPNAGFVIPEPEPLYEVNLGGKNYTFSSKQALIASVHESRPEVRVVLVLGGKQTGKTEGVSLALVRQIVQYPQDEFLIVAPDYKKLDDSTLKKFLELSNLIPGFIIPSSQKGRKHSTEQKAKLVTYNDSVIFYRSTDRYSTFEGMTLRAAWVDEVQHVEEEVVREILWHRLSIKRGVLYLSGAYLRPEQWSGHWLEEYRNAALAGDKEILLVEFSAFDLQGLVDRKSGKPLFSAKELERKYKRLPPQVFQAEVLGIMQSATRDNHIFPATEIKKAVARWPEKFSQLPQNLYNFFVQRLQQSHEEVPPKAQKNDHLETMIIGVDVAEYGGDSICVSFRSGRTVYWVENWGGMSIPTLERELAKLYKECDKIIPCTMIVDEGGLGKGVPSHLVEMDVNARGIAYNEATSDPAYTSIKSELYFRLKDWLVSEEKPLTLPPVNALIEQMSKIKYEVSNDKKKLSVIKPKDSPDELDSIVVGIIAGDGEIPIYFRN